MERLVKGDVVVLPFPYTDLSAAKKRPSLVVANLKGDNIILCQITGQARPDQDLINLKKDNFQTGGLHRDIATDFNNSPNCQLLYSREQKTWGNILVSRYSFIMPSFLFTIHKSKIDYLAGKLKQEKIKEVEKKLCEIFTR